MGDREAPGIVLWKGPDLRLIPALLWCFDTDNGSFLPAVASLPLQPPSLVYVTSAVSRVPPELVSAGRPVSSLKPNFGAEHLSTSPPSPQSWTYSWLSCCL